MFKVSRWIALAAHLSFCLASPAMAMEADPLEILFGEIPTVVVASKRAERVNDAPGVISLVTAEDIRRYGAQDLPDLLSRLPNVGFMNSVALHDTISIRGQQIGQTGEHTLYLVNGRPLRDSLAGSVLEGFLATFPLESVERIEVIRGPGSVLYGSGAFSGAVNIVTKTAGDKVEATVSGTAGSFKKLGYEFSARTAVGEDGHLALAGRQFGDHGWHLEARNEGNIFFQSNSFNDGYSGFADFKHKRVRLMAMSTYLQNNNLGALGGAPLKIGGFRRDLINAGYTQPIGSNWNISLDTTYNGDDFDFIGRDYRKVDDILYELSFSGKISDGFNVVGGHTRERHHGIFSSPNLAPPVLTAYTETWNNSYLQADWRPIEKLKLIAGAQANHTQAAKTDYSPRAGAIVNFTPEWGAKLLVGKAFRSPSGSDLYILNIGSLTGNPNLIPEKILTWDAQVSRETARARIAVNLYHSTAKDGIIRVPNPLAAGNTFVNRDKQRFQGGAVDGRLSVTQAWEVTGSCSYQDSEDLASGRKQIGYFGHYMVKAGTSYSGKRGVTVGVFDSYFSEPQDVRDIGFPNAPQRNPKAREYHWVTANVSVDLAKLVGGSFPDITFSLYGQNLLDEDVFFPEFNRKGVNTLPQAPGSSFYTTLSLKF